MPYVLKRKNTPKVVTGWPVFIPQAADGGRSDEFKTTFDFEILSQAEHDAVVKAGAEKDGNVDSAIMLRVVQGWGGMVDEDKNDVPFDKEALEEAVEQTNVRQAFITEYMRARTGQKASRKN